MSLRLGGHFQIAPNFYNKDWWDLKLDTAQPNDKVWVTAVAVLQKRIEDRFIDAADKLIDLGKAPKLNLSTAFERFGFAILAIDFLVLETIEGFRAGLDDHKGKSKELCVAFLIKWGAFTSCVPTGKNSEELAKRIYEGYRCALLHSGSTNNNFSVGVSDAAFSFNNDNININRTKFHSEIKKEFRRYLDDLLNPKTRD